MSEKMDLILTALTEFKAEFNQFKGENREAFDQFRKDYKADFDQLKNENKAEFEQLKKENRAEFEQFRTEYKSEFDQLKSENRAEFDQFRTEYKSDFDQFKHENQTQLDRIERAVIRLEKNQSPDIMTLLQSINSKVENNDHRSQALNKRLFKVESDIERLSHQ